MIVSENITLNGIEYVKTYSDTGHLIERGGIFYAEAIDPVGLQREYVETEVKDEFTEELSDEITGEEFLAMFEGVL